MRVLYIIDNASREQLAANLVRHELEKRGCVVYFASRYVISNAFNGFQPDIVILPKIHKIPEIFDLAKRCHIALLSAESFTGSEQSALFSYEGYQKINDCIDIRFCWGNFDKNVLKRARVFQESVLVATGHPMTDTWYLPSMTRNKDNRIVIGISSTLKVLANAFGNRNFLSLIDGIEKNTDAAGKSIYFDDPNHAEWWIGFEAAFIRIMINIADFFPNYEIRIRPHPTERATDYLALAKNRPNVKISEGGDIESWLDEIDILLSFLSVSQIDASVKGKHVISLKNLFPSWVIDGLPERLRLAVDDFFPAPSSLEELNVLINRQPDDYAAVRTYVADVFNFPSERRPSELISEYIVKYLDSHVKRPMAGTPMPTSKLRFLLSFPYGDVLLMIALDLRTLLKQGKGGVGHSYCFHRFQRNLGIARRALEIIKRTNARVTHWSSDDL